MKKSEFLRRCREHIAEPDRWCKDRMAVNKDGKECESISPNAVQWCAIGSMRLQFNQLLGKDALEADASALRTFRTFLHDGDEWNRAEIHRGHHMSPYVKNPESGPSTRNKGACTPVSNHPYPYLYPPFVTTWP